MWCRICCVDGSRLTTPQDFNLKLHEFVHYNTYVCVFLSIKIVPPAPSVKRVPGLVLGSKGGTWVHLAVPHIALALPGGTDHLVGLGCLTPAVGGVVCPPASSLPGLQEIASHWHIVPA